ncbi:PKD domain-containing protein [Pedobacter sp. LMG 31464]|uniref:PKD domain-containing protein n=1 Tax=Pedobacter planticolens TaxID=2679964 RepID=A0A923IV20_9SPHI|nr:PKD domain-containing protein [Pedobacter planticolens]MBB2146595.1 PKD domain-containing protein [Pedobacter planticolens]
MKLARILLLSFFCALAFPAFAQLTIGTVDPGPYTPGSTIAATFTISNSSCIAQGNTFNLRLSNASGNFSPGVIIGSYNGFYGAFVNGTIPSGTPTGNGYKVRVESTNPAYISTESAAFEIRAGGVVTAQLNSTLLSSTNTEVFGTCTSKPNNNFFLDDESTTGSTVTATVTDEINGGTPTNLSFSSGIVSYTAQLAHYTIFTKARMSDGTIGTKAYFIINNSAVTAFSTSGNNVVCLPLGYLEFTVVTSGSGGIQNNFPGDTYKINWGDGSPESSYTFCEIVSNLGKVRHLYTQSSCGSNSTGSSGTIYNVFDVVIKVNNSFCGDIGTPVSSTAKVVAKPVNSFTPPLTGCTNTIQTFLNTSVSGENPNTNTPGCTPNNVTYNWFVDGVPVKVNQPRSYNLQWTFLTHGNHVVRLESTSSGVCDADPIEHTICIQDPPVPSFNFNGSNGATVCAPNILKPTNTSFIDNICNANNTYSWSVSPAVGYANGTNANSAEPEFNFTTPGIYQVTLSISTASCGTVSSAVQTVIVNGPPTISLSPNAALCNVTTYDFNPTTNGPTKTSFTGTQVDLPATYTWSVAGGAFAFTGGTTVSSKYPSIQFLDYATYTVTVTHTNTCGTITKSQIISFTSAPVVDAGPDQIICYNDPLVNLNGSVSGTPTSIIWVGGGGIFSPDRNTLNATYTPTTAERNAGQVTLTLRATTSLPAPCNRIDNDVIITIKKEVVVSSAATKSICTGTSVNYNITSTSVGATFTWTASGSTNAGGFTNGSGLTISDVLTNSDLNANATVTYTITPSANGCTGNPFTFTVTVTPNPILTPTATNATICSGQSAGINLSSNLGITTKYTWTSTVTGGVTGNTNNPTATTTSSINDILLNSGTSSGTVTYTITPISATGCPGDPKQITITVEPQPTTPIAGPDESICNTNDYTLKGNQPIVGAGEWKETSNIGGITFDDKTVYNTTAHGLQPGNTYTFSWTITGAASCAPKTDDVKITVNPVSVGGSTAASISTVCAGNNSGTITLTGQTGTVIRWESSTDNFVTTTPIANTTTSLTYTNLNATTQYRAVVQSGVCAPANSTISTITVNQGAVTATASPDQILCDERTTTLAGNDPLTNIGEWTLISGQTGVTFNANQYNTAVSGIVGGQTYIFRWTISGLAPCPATSDEVTITNLSALQNNTISTPGTTVCTGQTITIVGLLPTGGNNVYTYTWQSSADGGATWNPISGQTSRDLIIPVSTNLSYRRIVTSGTCSSPSNPIAITVLPPIANNTIAADQIICITTLPNQLTGSQPTGGDGANYTYQWQQSTDNGTTWNPIPSTDTRNYPPPAITQTTLYRRLVSSGACTGSQQSISGIVKITVNLNAKAEFTFTNDIGCVPFKLDGNNIKAVPYPTRNATYTWYADNVQIGTGINFPSLGYTIPTDNTNVVIKLVVTSSLGCQDDVMTHTFSTRQTITSSYRQSATEGCGPLDVTFTNTSTSLTNATFLWDFGNNTTSTQATPPPIRFLADPSGKDITYTVTLTSTTPCGSSTTTSTVFIKANPISVFSPDKTVGCSPFLVNFSNTSPGGTNTYTYDFGDGSAPFITNNKNSVSHTYTTGRNITTYTVTMTAQNDCGTDVTQYTIQVSPNTITPELVVNSNELRGCAPLTVHFFNNTSGANSFTYTFGNDGTANTLSAPETVTHTFTQPGIYTVRLDATNGCSNASTTETITVLAQPKAEFHGDILIGCTGLSVKFTNTSTDGVSYLWDFGDLTFSRDVEPTHVYIDPAGSYTVKLTTYNNLGCPNTATLTDYIRIVGPPKADFSTSPAPVVSIPTYTFKFTDESTNAPKTYRWTFGDGDASLQKDPTHTYADTGRYLVTMRTYNEYGCADSIQKFVQIIGVPGYMYVPNSFIPGGTSSQLQKFIAIGSGIKSWHMSVFNKWGQVLWETTQLNDGKPVEGWDGTYKNTPQPQGIYFWKIDIEFINGTEWKGMTYDNSAPKRTGSIYLIR